MKNAFNVKDKSLEEFLKKYLLNSEPLHRRDPSVINSPYYFLKDEMFFKAGLGIAIGKTVVIELFDEGRYSQKHLANTYIYRAEAYDDVSIRMVLVDFSVTLKE